MALVEFMKNEYVDVSEPVHELALLVYNHFGKNPMGWTGIDKLTEYAHNEQFVERVFDLHNFLVATESIFDGINPSQYYKIIYKFQLATKSIHFNLEQIVQCYLDIANYAIKCYNNSYIDTSKKIQECTYMPVSNESDIRTIGYLCALLRSFSDSVYCDEHTISGEIISPIIIDNGFVIAREYQNLDAYELCPELLASPYKKINIYIKYSNGHLSVVEYLCRNYPNDTICVAVIKDFPLIGEKTEFDKQVDIEIAKKDPELNAETTLSLINRVLHNIIVDMIT